MFQYMCKVFGDSHTMARALVIQASLAVAEKRVDECIRCISEALVRHFILLLLSSGVLLCACHTGSSDELGNVGGVYVTTTDSGLT